MNLKPALVALLIISTNLAFASNQTNKFNKLSEKDTSYWLAGNINSVTFSQVMLKNWAGGGQPSVSINGMISSFADYKRERKTWENSLDMAYGLLKQGNRGSLVKSDDKVNFVSKFGYKIQKENEKWFYSCLIDFRSQFSKGKILNEKTGKRDSVVSKFMTPGYITIGLGADYKLSDDLSFNYIPLTGKFTIVNSQALADLGAFGVPTGSMARGEFGSYMRIKYKGEIIENVNLDSRVELFSNYTQEPGNVDVNIQNAFVLKVNRYLTANFYSQLLYDKDMRNKKDRNGDGELTVSDQKALLQYKSVIGFGVSYKVGAEKKKK